MKYLNENLEPPCEVHKQHSFLISDGCPFCKGEIFGPCECCEMYFCHGTCEAGVYDDEEMKESKNLDKKFLDNFK